MKQKKQLTSKTKNGIIKVTIEMVSDNTLLTFDEQKHPMNRLVDSVCAAVSETPYFQNYRHKVTVK